MSVMSNDQPKEFSALLIIIAEFSALFTLFGTIAAGLIGHISFQSRGLNFFSVASSSDIITTGFFWGFYLGIPISISFLITYFFSRLSKAYFGNFGKFICWLSIVIFAATILLSAYSQFEASIFVLLPPWVIMISSSMLLGLVFGYWTFEKKSSIRNTKIFILILLIFSFFNNVYYSSNFHSNPLEILNKNISPDCEYSSVFWVGQESVVIECDGVNQETIVIVPREDVILFLPGAFKQ